MRDTLTVIAALVVLVLAAALAVPPLVDWEARRGWVEDAITRAAGVPARTAGSLSLRLLPAPRLQVDRLSLGEGAGPGLRAEGVEAEIGLTPLLRGEVRLTRARAGRVEVNLPGDGDGPRLRPDVLDALAGRREPALDDLEVGEVVLNAGGGSVQLRDVRASAPAPAGPWTVEGAVSGAPFRLATGAMGPDRTVQLRFSGGGNRAPRFDLDARLAWVPAGGGFVQPALQGTGRVSLGPPAQAGGGVPIPVLVQAAFRAGPERIDLDPLSIEAGEGAGSLRLAGSGVLRLDENRAEARLEGRRLDVDGFLLSPSGRELLSRGDALQVPLPRIPVALALTINSLGLAQEEFQNLVVRGSLERGRIQVARAEVTAPGQTRVEVAGAAGLGAGEGVGGRFSLRSEASDRFARTLGRLGAPARLTAYMDGRRVEASGEVELAGPVLALRGLAVAAGEARLTGDARLTEPAGGRRGRIEARIGLENADLAELPRVADLFDASQAADLDLALDARRLRHLGRPGAGRIEARIRSDGASLQVENLEITDLAGANARASGRIAPDGSGRITGEVRAPRAAPLVDLVGTVWMGGVSRLVPAFLRERELRLDVVAERAAPDPASGEPRLRTLAEGTAAGGTLRIEAVTGEGRTQNIALRLATPNTGTWVDKPDLPLLRRPSSLEVRGVRVVGGAFNLTARGEVGGVRVATARPLVLGEADDLVEAGALELAAADLTPFLALLGDGAAASGPVPAELRAEIGRDADASTLAVQGRVAGEGVGARLAFRPGGDARGEVTLSRLHLPWLANALVLGAAPDPATWSAARWGRAGGVLRGGSFQVRARRAGLGQGWEAENAGFTLLLTPEGLEIAGLSASLAGGQLTGALRITRQEAQASVAGEGRIEAPLSGLAPALPFGGRLRAALRFGGAGESAAALVNNLGGSGEAGLTGLSAPEADPGGLDRALLRLLAEADPLQPRRIDTVVAEELRRAPFTAPQVAAPLAIAGGVIRLNPVRAVAAPAGRAPPAGGARAGEAASAGEAAWRGAVALDLRTLRLDAAGALSTALRPQHWLGAPPQVGLAWRGPLGALRREVDTGPLASGIAAVVLQRELDQIDRLQAETGARPPSPPGGAGDEGRPSAPARPDPAPGARPLTPGG